MFISKMLKQNSILSIKIKLKQKQEINGRLIATINRQQSK